MGVEIGGSRYWVWAMSACFDRFLFLVGIGECLFVGECVDWCFAVREGGHPIGSGRWVGWSIFWSGGVLW